MSVLNTNHIPLFGSSGDYYAQARFTYEKDPINQTIKVTVNGVRAYSKYGWNFGTNVTVWLASDSKGTDKVPKPCKIDASGSRYYEGWLPKKSEHPDGYEPISVSKTFKYNADGSLPKIYLHIEASNPNVLYISAGTYHSVYVSITKNIGTTTYFTELDVRPPTITFKAQARGVENSKATVQFYATSNAVVDMWQYNIDSGNNTAITVDTDYKCKSTTVKNLTFTRHTVKVRGRRKYNRVWSPWVSYVFDCRLPNVTNALLVGNSINTGNLSYDSTTYKDIPCQCAVVSEDSTKTYLRWTDHPITTQKLAKVVTVVNNSNLLYLLKVRRKDHTAFVTQRVLRCDTKKPTLSIESGPTQVGSNIQITVKSDAICKNWVATLNNTTQKTSDTQGTSKTFIFENVSSGDNNVITISATKVSNNVLGTTTTERFTVESGAYIFDGDRWTDAQVYVYSSNQNKWMLAKVLVYKNGKWIETKNN